MVDKSIPRRRPRSTDTHCLSLRFRPSQHIACPCVFGQRLQCLSLCFKGKGCACALPVLAFLAFCVLVASCNLTDLKAGMSGEDESLTHYSKKFSQSLTIQSALQNHASTVQLSHFGLSHDLVSADHMPLKRPGGGESYGVADAGTNCRTRRS
jgi:hypothetical protein